MALERIERRMISLNDDIDRNKEKLLTSENDLNTLVTSGATGAKVDECKAVLTEQIRNAKRQVKEQELRLTKLVTQKQKFDDLEKEAQKHPDEVAEVLRKTLGQ